MKKGQKGKNDEETETNIKKKGQKYYKKKNYMFIFMFKMKGKKPRIEKGEN